MNYLSVFAGMPSWAIVLIIVGIFGVIVLMVILLKKNVKAFKSEEKPKSEKEIAAEELDRVLQPIEEELVEEKGEEAEESETPKE
ncbi:MAG: hypothetical protein II467_00435 [Bacilli bacterium]|nr:hypothetical protein [Bacilli bacterium]MBQ4255645.1 hypothetical protein [Bacilli bacterium]